VKASLRVTSSSSGNRRKSQALGAQYGKLDTVVVSVHQTQVFAQGTAVQGSNSAVGKKVNTGELEAPLTES
jgi:hypothetical protein